MNTYETYVSLEVAKLLKQAGFDWECSHWLSNDGSLWITDRETNNLSPENKKRFLHCPSLAVAQKWLREVKNIQAVPWRWPTKVGFVEGYKPWSYKITFYQDLEDVDIDDFNASGEDYFRTYEEALEAGIKKCLESILEKDDKD